MSIEGSLGSLLQGVSQQPFRNRAEGTLTAQVNYISDVVQGLTARPALHLRGTVLNSPHTGLAFLDVQIGGEEYVLGYKPGVLQMWTGAGVEQTVTPQDAAALAYIGADMRAYVFNDSGDDEVFLTNRDVLVAKAAAPVAGEVVDRAGIALCVGGMFSRTYTATILYADGAVAVGTYKTPTGTNAGDADKTAAPYIIEQLRVSLNAHGSKKVTTTLTRSEGTLYIKESAANFSLKVDDEGEGVTIRCFTTATKETADLAETAPHGMLVRITGDDGGGQDDYYLRFASATTTTVGAGFGSPGTWEEWYNVAEVAAFDLTTMPHALVRTGPSTFSLQRGGWLPRRVGDAETNPFPDFVGSPIRDLGGFQSRLVVVGGGSCSMSRTRRPLDFFKETALTELVTDPVNITSTEATDGADVRLDWIVPFDRDLVLMADPGRGQYIITGEDKITSANAAMVLTTAFEMQGGAKPVATGRTVLFPFKSGRFSGIKEFFTNDAVATNGADTLTEAADRYIEGLVDHARCSTNFNMAVFKTTSPQHTTTIWCYKYLWAQTEKIQSAWSKWQMPLPVRHFYFSGSELVVVMEKAGSVGGTSTYIFTALDLDIPVDDLAQYHICLDLQETKTVAADNTVVLPYIGARFVQGEDCPNPGAPASASAVSAPDASGNVTYTLYADAAPAGAAVICGLPYSRWFAPTMPVARGRDGRPLPRVHLVVNGFMVEYRDTGYLKAVMDSRYRTDPIEYVVDWFNTDDDAADPLRNGVRSGILHVPWGERSDWSELTIFSDDVRPTTILDIAWTGQAFKGGRE
jgi:hypothetical protein